ncbi:MAG: insulinase family protein [Aeromonas sp.]
MHLLAANLNQSPNDHRHYRALRLDNNLRVLLICDPSSDKSAASLAVNCGHFADPSDRQGLAHFLEHMLFLGTETFPQAGEYQQFMTRHGGSHNAWTGTEHTNFFFEIDNEFYAEGLHRFSQFFICPTFDKTMVDKERNAVEAEYRLKLQDDARRSYQVHKETVNPAHPFAKFSVGNLDTLGDHPDRALYDDLLAFYQSQYSSERMALVMLAPAELDQMQAWCERYFSPILARNLPSVAISAPLYRPEDVGLRIDIQPIKEKRKLVLAFALPNLDAHYRVKPLISISHLIGYEGQGSLLSLLKARGWANQLSAGSGISGSNFKDYNVQFSLTAEGLRHVDAIIDLTFGYLALMRREGLEAWRYHEKQQVVASAFATLEGRGAIETVSERVMDLFTYAPEDWLAGDFLMQGFDEALVRGLLEQLTPDNLRVLVTAPEVQTDKIARWYATPYAVTRLDGAQLASWHAATPDSQLALPAPNPFISDRLTARPAPTAREVPTRLIDKPGLRLWHLHEHEFALPKGNVYISIDSAYAMASTRNVAMTRLLVEVLTDHLNALLYPAELAGLGYLFYAHQGGVTIQLSGFAQKQLLLLETILKNRTFGYPDPARFDEVKVQLLRSWENQRKARPINQLFSQLGSILQRNNPPVADCLAALRDITREELPEFVQNLFAHVHVEALVHGDWTQAEALQLSALVENLLVPDSTASMETQRPLTDLRGQGTAVFEVETGQQDSALLLYYQGQASSPRDVACYCFADHIMSSNFFHELRTRQQLGYVVGSNYMPINNHPGLIFYVQSPVAGPAALQEAINDFVNLFPLAMFEISQTQWQQSKDGLLALWRERDTHLQRKSQRFWQAISQQDFAFNQRELVCAELENLSRVDLVRFITQLRSRTSDRVLLCSFGQAHAEDQRLSAAPIPDLAAFLARTPTF